MRLELLPDAQTELSRRLPLCMAMLLGTHNSGITIADGYGNRDEHFQQYFKWIRWVVSCHLPPCPLPCKFFYVCKQGIAARLLCLPGNGGRIPAASTEVIMGLRL